MSMAWIAAQIQRARETGALNPPQLLAFNPRPPGVAIEGSATTAVLQLLKDNPARWFTHQQIQVGINASRPESQQFSRVSVDWALIRLRSWAQIEAAPEKTPGRSSRYQVYRFKPTTTK